MMAVTTAQAVDIAQLLADIIDTVDELRVAWWVSDASRPPVAIITQPTIDYADPTAPFCYAVWTFGVAIVVNRANDREAQRELSRLVSEVAVALDTTDAPAGVFDIAALDARPSVVTVAGTDLPAYELRVRIRA